jgi:hypothetical protein
MGVICIGGLMASTLLTLLVVPIAYTLIDDAQGAALRLLRRAARRGNATEAANAPPA